MRPIDAYLIHNRCKRRSTVGERERGGKQAEIVGRGRSARETRRGGMEGRSRQVGLAPWRMQEDARRAKNERRREERLGLAGRGSVRWRRRCRDAVSGHARATRRRAASRRADDRAERGELARELPSLDRRTSIGCAHVDPCGLTWRPILTSPSRSLAGFGPARDGALGVRMDVPTGCRSCFYARTWSTTRCEATAADTSTAHCSLRRDRYLATNVISRRAQRNLLHKHRMYGHGS